jgi:hypothetical protein
VNGKFFCKRRHHGADHRHAEQDIDFLLQAFFTMPSINSGRQLKSDPIVKNKAIASIRISKFLATASRSRARPRPSQVSLLGSVENEAAICSEPIKKKAPAEARAFGPMNSFGKISTSRQPGR